MLAHVDEDDVRLEYTGHDTQEQLVHGGTRDFHLVDESSPQIFHQRRKETFSADLTHLLEPQVTFSGLGSLLYGVTSVATESIRL